MQIRFISPAYRELEEAATFYDEVSVGLGKAFLDEIERVTELMRANPMIGYAAENDLRSIPLSRFPFNVVYVLDDGMIVIIAVAHQRRRPNYWEARRS